MMDLINAYNFRAPFPLVYPTALDDAGKAALLNLYSPLSPVQPLARLLQSLDTKLKTLSFVEDKNVTYGEAFDVLGKDDDVFPRVETLVLKFKSDGYADQKNLNWSVRMATAVYMKLSEDNTYATVADYQQITSYGMELSSKIYSFLDDNPKPCDGFEWAGEFPEVFIEKEVFPRTMTAIVVYEFKILLDDMRGLYDYTPISYDSGDTALETFFSSLDKKLKTLTFVEDSNVTFGEAVDIIGLEDSMFPRAETLITKIKGDSYSDNRNLNWAFRCTTAIYFRTATDDEYPTLAEMMQAATYAMETSGLIFSFLADKQAGYSPAPGFQKIGAYPEIFLEKEIFPKTMAGIVSYEAHFILDDKEGVN